MPAPPNDPSRKIVCQNRKAWHLYEIEETFEAGDAYYMTPGHVPEVRPRIMHVPGGAQSMLLWTEHADKTCLQSHRAVYFGRSDVDSAGNAVGGFVASGITVTKSVFRENPDNVPCTESWPARQAALDDPGFFRFCRELAGLGHEICVHAPRPRDAGPASGPETAQYMANMFGARTWIDHSARSVHCGMTGQGLNPDSPYSMAEAWRRWQSARSASSH